MLKEIVRIFIVPFYQICKCTSTGHVYLVIYSLYILIRTFREITAALIIGLRNRHESKLFLKKTYVQTYLDYGTKTYSGNAWQANCDVNSATREFVVLHLSSICKKYKQNFKKKQLTLLHTNRNLNLIRSSVSTNATIKTGSWGQVYQ